jgi:mevalonate kinase
MKILAPGKLILSGEHAVVHGHPALAMAVNRYAITTATPQLSPTVSFDLSDLAYQRRLSLSALNSLKNRIKRKYQRFVNGDFKIRDVLQKPVELAQIAFSLLLETLNLKLTQGVNIHVQSTIPIGCGMGSSAATILSIVHALAHHFRVTLTPDALFHLGLEAENMQHGYSSGLDLRVSLHGGCIYVKDNTIHARVLPKLSMFLVNTGLPITHTGECVTAVANYFKVGSLGDDFAAVTTAMDIALQQEQLSEVKRMISENHQLLVQINVVPLKVQHFISAIQQNGGAAKICGAGAVAGDNGGIVLVLTDDEAALQTLCSRFHYTHVPIAGEPRGVHIV